MPEKKRLTIRFIPEGDDTAYGQALFPIPAEDPNDPLQVSSLRILISSGDVSSGFGVCTDNSDSGQAQKRAWSSWSVAYTLSWATVCSVE
jgi:hypothetical protein